MKRVCAFLLSAWFLLGSAFSEQPKPRVSDYFVAFGEEALVELFGAAYINLRSPRPQGLKFDDVIYSITKQPYVWDKTSFSQNQITHPYAGNLYFNTARANNLNFWTSLVYTAWGSWSWENIYQNSVTSYNDLITTTMAGALTGEVLHRLSYCAGQIWEPLLWVLSPIDGINRLLRGEQYRHAAPEDLNMLYHSEFYAAFSGAQFFEAGSMQFVPLAEFHPYIVYGNPFDHKTDEPLDLFSADGIFYTSLVRTMGFFDLDGALYSWPFFQNTDLPSTVGINFNYKMHYFDEFNYSTNGLGIFMCQQIPFGKENIDAKYFYWNLEADFVFLEASKQKNVNYYNCGPEFKVEVGLETDRVSVRAYGQMDFAFPQNVWHSRDFVSVDIKILDWLCVGVEDLLICKEGDVRNFTSVGVKVRK